MSVDIHPEARALLASKVDAHVVTTRANGRPHVSMVWVDVDDEGHILFGTPPWRVKAKNLRRDPNVIVSITDSVTADNGLHRHLVVEGIATIDHDAARAKRFMDDLMLTYTGKWGFDLKESEDFVLVSIEPIRVTGHGPWHTGRTTSYGTPV